MAIVNITQAAKLAGLSRSYFQRKYIKTGVISSTAGKDGQKEIDTSDLLRVFGEFKDTPEHSDSTVTSEHQYIPQSTPQYIPSVQQQIRLAELEVENRMLREQMDEIKDQHAKQIQLLQHIVDTHKPWWKFWDKP
ncbi:MAG: hypothetical protein ACPGVP_22030 [Thiolinea sp.]